MAKCWICEKDSNGWHYECDAERERRIRDKLCIRCGDPLNCDGFVHAGCDSNIGYPSR